MTTLLIVLAAIILSFLISGAFGLILGKSIGGMERQ